MITLQGFKYDSIINVLLGLINDGTDSKAISAIKYKFGFGDFYYLQGIFAINLN